MADDLTRELLNLNQSLLDAITRADWETYEKLCDPTLTSFEPESMGHLVEGMGFHRFYFDLGGMSQRHNTTMASPHVRILGDVAIIAYIRLIQHAGIDGPATIHFEETRIWHKQNDQWKHVHFHRSRVAEK